MALSPEQLTLTPGDIEVVEFFERMVDGDLQKQTMMPDSKFVLIKDLPFGTVWENQDTDAAHRIFACLCGRYVEAGWSKFEYLRSSDTIVLYR